MIRRMCGAAVGLALSAVSALALQTPAVPDEFVPISELPPGEQLPAAPFLIGAYAFFLVLMVFYVWTIRRRLTKVERDMHELARRAERHGSR